MDKHGNSVPFPYLARKVAALCDPAPPPIGSRVSYDDAGYCLDAPEDMPAGSCENPDKGYLCGPRFVWRPGFRYD